MPVSIREVAAAAGVSISTVSKVLNGGGYTDIAPATQERVRQVAQELGYHPRAVARGLVGKRMNSIGIVICHNLPSVTSDPYVGPVLDGILDRNKHYHQKTVIFAEDTWNDAFSKIPLYCDGSCDGLIVFIPLVESPFLERLQKQEIPFLLVGDSREQEHISTVDIDNIAVARLAVAHLLQLGHRRIAMFCGNSAFLSSAQRAEGYRQELAAWGVPYDPSLVWKGQYWEWAGAENAEKLLQMPPSCRPTAIFCQDDRLAAGAYDRLRAAGLQIPRDISIIGLSDYAEAQERGITTVRFPLRQIGAEAVNLLLALIQQQLPRGTAKRLSGELVVRNSTAPPLHKNNE
ncbi:transcriptional regulator, LacI family [Chthonomonas calidirosea]|uniref:Transcriptional regulator, LacI family n=1 Tax=Chthonomonas calidirosea (strain DSM 23976 / ICMP 18418 / T49) TaxID=1303518 RepID=S0F024_CHTCT|nr:LacI family DNA-binding transcriptional regulator [Chthonomonas calidirosea]CCW36377.1 transcriptional regulator, LacI family [Chthonomonas calidirosea T49]CEK16440.1 transcriptional regulator, LacI family [Chthonomonas calidirosea]CEK16441.1 transcriptional regulator, LacI family [Chthonomonas calidirosea]CEK17514.1 transcriptional regulator, LacI family [Chthonomonas calidirosea]